MSNALKEIKRILEGDISFSITGETKVISVKYDGRLVARILPVSERAQVTQLSPSPSFGYLNAFLIKGGYSMSLL